MRAPSRGGFLHKTDYLQDADVKAFVSWFATELELPTLRHRYETARPSKKFVFDHGLADALSQYHWPYKVTLPGQDRPRCGSSYKENECILHALRGGLEIAVARGQAAVHDWCLAIAKWGGVIASNASWLGANRRVLLGELATVSSLLRAGNDELSRFTNIRRFNAAMTKVYALLLPDVILYDSRVAAALAWFVASWCRETNRPTVPDLLAFPCMRARGRRQTRKPGSAATQAMAASCSPPYMARHSTRAGIFEQAGCSNAPSR